MSLLTTFDLLEIRNREEPEPNRKCSRECDVGNINPSRGAAGMIRAAACGSLHNLNSFISLGIQPDTLHGMKTALGEAAARGHYECVQALVQAGADANYAITGINPFMRAILAKRKACVELFLQQPTLSLAMKDCDNVTTLMYAAQVGDISTTQHILQHGHEELLNGTDCSFETVVTHAAVNGHKEYLQHVIPLMQFSSDLLTAAAHDNADQLRCLLGSDERPDPCVTELSGLSPLMICAILDHRECLDVLLEHGADWNMKDSTGRKPIHYAAACGNNHCMQRLIEEGALVSSTTMRWNNCLMLAAKNGYADCVAIALQYMVHEQDKYMSSPANKARSKDTNGGHNDSEEVPPKLTKKKKHSVKHKKEAHLGREQDKYMSSPANKARSKDTNGGHNDNEEVPPKLAMKEKHSVEHNKEARIGRLLCSIDHSKFPGQTALMHASVNGHVTIVRMLLDAGASVDVYSRPFQRTAMMLAAASGHTNVVEELIRGGASLNKQDTHNFSALFHAAQNGHTPCVQLLLQAGAHISLGPNFKGRYLLGNYAEGKQTAFDIALHAGYEDCAEILMRAMSPYQLKARTGMRINGNVILDAAKNGSVKFLKLFLAAGLNLSEVDCRGNTPLIYATVGCHLECIKFLVEDMRVPVNDCNNLGLNALAVAVLYDLPDPIVEYLIAAGSTVHSGNRRTYSLPIHYACFNGNARQVRCLLSAQARVTDTDRHGYTPLDIAAVYGRPRVIPPLLEAVRMRGLVDPEKGNIQRKAFLHAMDANNPVVVEIFLKSGMFDWSWYTLCERNTPMLIKALVTSGISPGTFHDEEYKHIGPSSPLMLAIRYRDTDTAKYLLHNLYFTVRDFQAITNCHILPRNLNKIHKKSVKQLSSLFHGGPLPLATLSFLAVSASVSGRSKSYPRDEAVEKLPLPNCLKRKLCFQDQVAHLCNTEWNRLTLVDPGKPSVLLQCVRKAQPFARELYPCQKPKTTCFCQKQGFSFFDSRQMQGDRAIRYILRHGRPVFAPKPGIAEPKMDSDSDSEAEAHPERSGDVNYVKSELLSLNTGLILYALGPRNRNPNPSHRTR